MDSEDSASTKRSTTFARYSTVARGWCGDRIGWDEIATELWSGLHDEIRSHVSDCGKRTAGALHPFFLEGVGGSSSLNQADGIHPTGEGYMSSSVNLLKTLIPILNEKPQKLSFLLNRVE